MRIKRITRAKKCSQPKRARKGKEQRKNGI